MPLERDDLHISPEQEHLNRQLETLQRYVSDLQQQREHAKAAPERRPSGRWLLVTGLLVVLALVGGVFVGAVAWSDDRPPDATAGATSTAAQVSSPAATPVASLACKTAVDRANTMLAIAVKLHRELVEYNKVMTDPASRDLSGGELVDQSVPALQAGTSESARFTQALADYRQVVDQCEVRKP
jgi:hypothetical protein